MDLNVVYEDHARRLYAEVALRLIGVRQIRLWPDMIPAPFLAEMEIEDIRSRQMEDISYVIRCYTSGEFEAMCKDIEIDILSVSTLPGSGCSGA